MVTVLTGTYSLTRRQPVLCCPALLPSIVAWRRTPFARYLFRPSSVVCDTRGVRCCTSRLITFQYVSGPSEFGVVLRLIFNHSHPVWRYWVDLFLFSHSTLLTCAGVASPRFYRYLWYLIRLSAFFTYRPVPLPENPTYIASEDVTIVVPTIDAGEEFKEAANSWLAGKPKEILIITEEKMIGPLQELANAVDPERIRVLSVPFANKRLQMSHGIKNVTTDIIVFADDDAIWPPTLLPYTLACFEDQKIGGVGTSQRVQPCGNTMTVWEVLAAFRLTIRNIEISASTHIDGGIPCLSGRTAAYRTVILKDPEFLHGFTHDFWLGKYQLNSGDDKFLTRWMVSHGWNTYVQVCKEAELLSTMKPNWRFLKQVLRWTRNTWRSDIRSLFTERYVWTSHPYVAYTMVCNFVDIFSSTTDLCYSRWTNFLTRSRSSLVRAWSPT